MRLTIKHIETHPKTGRLIYRRAFPTALRPLIAGSPQVLKRSLGAKNLSDPKAMAAYAAAQAEYSLIVAQAQKLATGKYDPLDRPLIDYLGAQFLHDSLIDDERTRKGLAVTARSYSPRMDPEGDYIVSRAMLEGRMGNLPDQAEEKGFDHKGLIAHWGPWTREYATAQGHIFDTGAETFGDLCEAIAVASCKHWLEIDRRNDGQPRTSPEAPKTPKAPERPQALPVPQGRSTAPLAMLALFDEYAAARKITLGVRADSRRYVVGLGAFIGHDDARALTTDNVFDWRDSLLAEMTNRGKLRDSVTVKKYIGAIKAMLGWAVSERRLSLNVAASVPVSTPRKPTLREKAFTAQEARTILQGTLSTPPHRTSPGYRRARRWIPWICAYTGARVNEISQLRRKDVQLIEGIWAINITPDAGTVKAKAARLVPLHSHLIEQGFIGMIEALPEGPIFYDPSQRRGQESGTRHFKKVGETLCTWVRKDLGITDPNVMPNHAWRNLFKTIALANGMVARTSDAITGHTEGSVARRYESVALAVCSQAMAQFPRFVVEGL